MSTSPKVAPVTRFDCFKQPARGSRGVVVTNHPLASAAGTEILLAGGNAVDAAVASLFALTVVEPMMVGIVGGGVAHIRCADGRHAIIDGLITAPATASPDMFTVLPGRDAGPYSVAGRENAVGIRAIGVPGSLAAWCLAVEKYGKLTIADVVAPAIRLAERGFVATPYLATCVESTAADLASDPGLARLFLPGDAPLKAGDRVVQPDYATSLRLVAQSGAAALYQGPLGDALVRCMSARDGLITADDLSSYVVRERNALKGAYRGYEILGPPPPAASGIHILQMLNIIEGYDIGAMGFGSADVVHLMAEAMKIASADRAAATGDPDFGDVPLQLLLDKAYAAERRSCVNLRQAKSWQGITPSESANTTHVTVADSDGNVISTTQTIVLLFGARVMIPGTGMLANDGMYNFDPRPGHLLSIAPGKRMFSSMSPMMVLREGKFMYALGLPGGPRIFPSAFQAIVNLLDHGMSLQEAVEAPRIYTDGEALEIEEAFDESVLEALKARGHGVVKVSGVAGGMNAVALNDDGTWTGAACWRADGTPIAVAGGLARPGAKFTIV